MCQIECQIECQKISADPGLGQGRGVGPPQVCNFSFLAFQGRLPALKSHRLKYPLACFILQPTVTPKATHQWLLMGVQACRLPALKRLKPLKTIKTLKTLTTRHGGSKPAVCHASSCSQQAPQGHTSMASYGRPSLPFASP